MKLMDFFEGIDNKRAKQIVKIITGERADDMTKKEFETIINNSTKIFRNTTVTEMEKFNKDETNRVVLHFIAGNNVKEFLKVK